MVLQQAQASLGGRRSGGDRLTDHWYGGSMMVIFKGDVQNVERELHWSGFPSTRATSQLDVVLSRAEPAQVRLVLGLMARLTSDVILTGHSHLWEIENSARFWIYLDLR